MTIKDKRGFTLVELLATIVVLALVMGIASYSIIEIINSSREKDYELLLENIKSAVNDYYIECKYVDDNCVTQMKLSYLVTNGYLKGNSTDSHDNLILVNPNDKVDISNCTIRYRNVDGKIIVEAVTTSGSCPRNYYVNGSVSGIGGTSTVTTQ